MNLLDKVNLLINVKLDEALNAGTPTPSVERLKAQKLAEIEQAVTELERLKQELGQLGTTTATHPVSRSEPAMPQPTESSSPEAAEKSAVVQNLETKLTDLENLLGQLKDQAEARSQQADDTIAAMNHPDQQDDQPKSEIIDEDPELAARKARLSA